MSRRCDDTPASAPEGMPSDGMWVTTDALSWEHYLAAGTRALCGLKIRGKNIESTGRGYCFRCLEALKEQKEAINGR